MRYFLFVLLFAFTSCKKGFEKAEIIPSKVDSLNNTIQIRNYLSVIDTNLRYFQPLSIQQLETDHAEIADSIMRILAKNLDIDKAYYKEDFDNNGYLDLLVLGGMGNDYTPLPNELYTYESFAVINFGKVKAPKLISLRRKMHLLDVPEIVQSEEGPMLLIHSPEKMQGPDAKITDTISIKLAYHYGGFAEYNRQPVDNHIEKIEFESGACFGTCPIYKLTINKDRSAVFLAEHYNFDKDKKSYDYLKKEGEFKGKINAADYENLTGLLNYIDFKHLKDNYHVTWTCSATATLTITYDNGKTKTISDYGFEGSYGLKSVYSILGDMRFNQKWEKVSETVSK